MRKLLKWFWAKLTGNAVTRTFGLALLFGLVLLRTIDPLPLEILRLKTFDLYQVLAPVAKAPQHQVMIVDIDEESLNEHGQWPWPRTKVAQMVTNIARNGGVTTAFDVIFAEPDRMSPAKFAEAVNKLDPALKQQLEALPSNDKALADAMRQTRVVVGQSGYYRKLEQKDRSATSQSSLATIGPDPRPYLFEFPSLVRNISDLEQAAAGRGLITIIPERDGIVRRVPVVMRSGQQVMPSLAIELLRVATGGQAMLVRSDEAGLTNMIVANVAIPTDRVGRVWFRFGPHDKSRYVSARHVLSNDDNARKLAGKLVIIGTSATGLHDIKATPVAAAIPGAEIHAQLLEGIMRNQLLQRPAYAVGAEIMLAIATGLLIILLVPVLGALTTLTLGAMMSAAVAALSYYLFVQHGFVFDYAFPMISSFTIFAALVFFNYMREEKQRQQIRGAFGQYLSPALVEQLAGDPERLVLGGETKTLSIMFSDVRGFTTISETYKSDPQGLTTLINRLLTPLSNVVINLNGTIDKYMGDNIMAFWNAPLDDEKHAVHACSAALEMLKSLEALNEERRVEDLEAGRANLPLNIGIGINTGDCVVGNIGSDMRFDYSVLGDSVNLASRLEGQTKPYGLDIIIGEGTAKLVEGEFAVLAVDSIRVKGKAEPESIFTLIGKSDVLEDPNFKALKQAHDAMIENYRTQNWQEATKALAECEGLAEHFGISGFYDVYSSRMLQFMQSPPGDDWDGVYTAETK